MSTKQWLQVEVDDNEIVMHLLLSIYLSYPTSISNRCFVPIEENSGSTCWVIESKKNTFAIFLLSLAHLNLNMSIVGPTLKMGTRHRFYK